jgi:hypothetical protein
MITEASKFTGCLEHVTFYMSCALGLLRLLVESKSLISQFVMKIKNRDF